MNSLKVCGVCGDKAIGKLDHKAIPIEYYLECLFFNSNLQ